MRAHWVHAREGDTHSTRKHSRRKSQVTMSHKHGSWSITMSDPKINDHEPRPQNAFCIDHHHPKIKHTHGQHTQKH